MSEPTCCCESLIGEPQCKERETAVKKGSGRKVEEGDSSADVNEDVKAEKWKWHSLDASK